MNQEAKRVIFENTTYKVEIIERNTELLEYERYAFANFRNVTIEAEMRPWYLNQRRKKSNTISSYLFQVKSILCKRRDRSSMRLRIKFKPSHQRRCHLKHTQDNGAYDPFDPSHQFQERLHMFPFAFADEYEVAWQRAHALRLIQRIRASIGRRAPYVTLESNVEQTGHNISVVRKSPLEVHFGDVKGNRQGKMFLNFKHAGYIHLH